MFKERLSVIIPTCDRPERLLRLLESLDRQDVKPLETIVVDASRDTIRGIPDAFTGLNVRHIRTPASLPAQRNAGLRALKEEATLVAFLDDDIVLERGALRNMMTFWESASPDTGGASFNNTLDSHKKPTLLEKIFMVNSEKPGRVLGSGYQSKQCSLGNTTQVDWLTGCAMTFRRSVFGKFTFDEWFAGYGLCEDLDFSYQVGKEYKLFAVADARIRHMNDGSENTESSVLLGRMQVVNRLHFVKKNPDLSVASFYWASFGLFLNNAIKGLFGFDRRYFLRSRGNIEGFISSIARPEK